MIVEGNRSLDHGPGVVGYQISGQSDFAEWASNLGTVASNDPGYLTSDNVAMKAKSLQVDDINAGRINGGIYDMRIASLAAAIDALANQNLFPMAYGETITFDDSSVLT
jgi:hypothetical protein